MKIDEALYQLKQNIKMHKIEGTTSNENEREKALLDYITNLQEENEKLEKEQLITNMAYETVLNFYKQRNEKAIEYIERCRNYHRNIHKEERIFSDEITSLLMILNGGDE